MRSVSGQELGNLLMDTQVNICIRSEDIHHGFVVDQLFDDEGGQVKADHVGLLDQVPKGAIW
jgi:hypothetical protein